MAKIKQHRHPTRGLRWAALLPGGHRRLFYAADSEAAARIAAAHHPDHQGVVPAPADGRNAPRGGAGRILTYRLRLTPEEFARLKSTCPTATDVRKRLLGR
jgi:hypothetical protein